MSRKGNESFFFRLRTHGHPSLHWEAVAPLKRVK
jgi:hypothetical protein